MKKAITTFAIMAFLLSPNSGGSFKQTKIFQLYIDSDFTLEEKVAILNASDAWTKTTKGMIGFAFAEKQVEFDTNFLETNHILRASPDDIDLLIFEKVMVGTNIIGYGPPSSFIILVPDRANSIKHFEIVAAHELGHHIGLDHTPAIMDSNPAVPCITKYDLIQFCDVYMCNPKELEPQCSVK